MVDRLQDVELFAGHAEEDRPLGGYAAMMALFALLAGGFTAWVRQSGRELPEGIAARDLVLISVATHKASRTIAKDRVTSAVRAPFTRLEDEDGPGKPNEVARGQGLRRAVGELIVCPYCLSLWIATALSVGLVVAPRPSRWLASILTAVFGSDLLQIAVSKAESTS